MISRTTLTLVSMALLVALAACGKRDELRPPEGHALPPKPATSAAQPDVETLMTPPVETRPGRSDDVLKRSEERPDDRFNLPPPG